MALLLKKLGGIDIFKMRWYRNLPDYFTYFSPVASPISGFGDMHDRVETGGLKGRSEMLTIGCEENNHSSEPQPTRNTGESRWLRLSLGIR